MAEPRRNWFYVPNCEIEYLTMEQCVEATGSGMLVARHTVLDDLLDLRSAYESAITREKLAADLLYQERTRCAAAIKERDEARAELAARKDSFSMDRHIELMNALTASQAEAASIYKMAESYRAMLLKCFSALNDISKTGCAANYVSCDCCGSCLANDFLRINQEARAVLEGVK